MLNLAKFWIITTYYYLIFRLNQKRVIVNQDEDYLYELLEKYVKTTLKYLKIDIIIKNENVKKNLTDNVLYVANHGSIFDSMFTYYAVGGKLAYFAAGDKRDMNEFPTIKKITDLADIIFVDRTSLRGSVRSIKEGTEVLQKGKSLFIFPEGEVNDHLPKAGREIAEFAPGSFRTAINAKKMVVPIAIKGANKIHNALKVNAKIKSGTVQVTFLEPITCHLNGEVGAVEIALKVEQMINNNLTKETDEKS